MRSAGSVTSTWMYLNSSISCDSLVAAGDAERPPVEAGGVASAEKGDAPDGETGKLRLKFRLKGTLASFAS